MMAGDGIRVVDVKEAMGRVADLWSPAVVGAVNDCHVKLARLKGAFEWHHHEHEDELFLVVKGTLRMRFRDRDLQVGEGQFVIVPRGVEHLPEADEEVHVLLFEPNSTVNTGNVRSARTRDDLQRL